MAASPLAHRGVAGSLVDADPHDRHRHRRRAADASVSRRIASAAAGGGGAGETEAFLAAFHTMFRIAGVAAASTGVLVAW